MTSIHLQLLSVLLPFFFLFIITISYVHNVYLSDCTSFIPRSIPFHNDILHSIVAADDADGCNPALSETDSEDIQIKSITQSECKEYHNNSSIGELVNLPTPCPTFPTSAFPILQVSSKCMKSVRLIQL